MIKGETRLGTIAKLKQEAKDVGVTWVKKIDGSSSLYRFPCNHEEKWFTNSVRSKRGVFKVCSACRKSKLKQRFIDEAKTQNLRWVHQIDNNYSMYEFPCGHNWPVQMHGMRRKNTPYATCDACSREVLVARYRSEAKSFAIELLYPHETKSKYWYCRPDNCRHLLIKTIRHITQGSISCGQCKLEKFQKEGAEKGLEPQYQISGSSNTWLWKFIKCGHTMRATSTNVRHSQPKCQECLKIKRSGQAVDAGLILLGPAKRSDLDANFRSYRIVECGHEKDLALSAVKDNSYSCRICEKIMWKDAAKKIGLTYVGEAPRRRRSVYKFDKCGHKRELVRSQVTLGTIINCDTCEENSWSQPSYVYLNKMFIHGGPTWLKLGHTNNMKTRIRLYGLASNIKCEVLIKSLFGSRTIAHEIEKKIQKMYLKQVLNPEDMRQYLTETGFTECYPEKLESEMIMIIDSMVQT
jgi:hypothetical protein